MVAVTHPTGNANVRAVLEALDARGLLDVFLTTLAATGTEWYLGLLPARLKEEALRRSYPIAREKIRARPFHETLRLVSVKLGALGRPFPQWASIDHVCRDLDASAAKYLAQNARNARNPDGAGISAVYCYEDAALDTFRRAKTLGIRCIYDLPIGYYRAARRVHDEERALMPEFADALTLDGSRDSAEKLERKEKEAGLADVIVACSDFVKTTLLEAGFEPNKIRVVQFGSPDGASKEWKPEDLRRPLRLLFAGLVIQRKGIGYLLHAIERLDRKDVELVVMGRLPARAKSLLRYKHLFRYEPPRPHNEVLELMKSCDLLVLPSLFEGQALVVLEAMKCGLPVIITPNTGAAHLVEEGREGFVVPIRSADALVEAIQWCAEHRDAIEVMGTAARKRAERVTWEDYRTQVANIIEERP